MEIRLCPNSALFGRFLSASDRMARFSVLETWDTVWQFNFNNGRIEATKI